MPAKGEMMRFHISISMGLLFAAFALPGMARASAMNQYSYRVVVPANGACVEQAGRLAARFAAETSLSNVTGTCEGTRLLSNEGQSYKQNIVVINYQSYAKEMPVQAIFGGVDVYGGPTVADGQFPSYGACLSARAAQLKLFTEYTGLTAVDSHCESGNDLIPDSWSLVIDGFGQAKATLYGLAPLQNFVDDGDAPSSDIMNVVTEKVAKYGGHVVFSTNDYIFYYSASGQKVSVASGPDFTNASECTSQLSEAQKIFNSPKDADVTVLCHEDNGSSYHVVAVGLYADATDLDVEANTRNYASFGECLADRARVEQNLRSEGASVYGEICSPSIRNLTGYTMHVYEPVLSSP